MLLVLVLILFSPRRLNADLIGLTCGQLLVVLDLLLVALHTRVGVGQEVLSWRLRLTTSWVGRQLRLHRVAWRQEVRQVAGRIAEEVCCLRAGQTCSQCCWVCV